MEVDGCVVLGFHTYFALYLLGATEGEEEAWTLVEYVFSFVGHESEFIIIRTNCFAYESL